MKTTTAIGGDAIMFARNKGRNEYDVALTAVSGNLETRVDVRQRHQVASERPITQRKILVG